MTSLFEIFKFILNTSVEILQTGRVVVKFIVFGAIVTIFAYFRDIMTMIDGMGALVIAAVELLSQVNDSGALDAMSEAAGRSWMLSWVKLLFWCSGVNIMIGNVIILMFFQFGVVAWRTIKQLAPGYSA